MVKEFGGQDGAYGPDEVVLGHGGHGSIGQLLLVWEQALYQYGQFFSPELKFSPLPFICTQ